MSLDMYRAQGYGMRGLGFWFRLFEGARARDMTCTSSRQASHLCCHCPPTTFQKRCERRTGSRGSYADFTPPPRPHGPGPVTTTRGPKGRRAAAAGALALLISDGWAAQQASAGAAATALATTTSSLAATVSSLGEARGGSPAACLSADSYPLKPSSKSRA
jgi:hypothetical protein